MLQGGEPPKLHGRWEVVLLLAVLDVDVILVPTLLYFLAVSVLLVAALAVSGLEYTYDILSLLFLGGNFLIALLAYLDNRNNKRK